jgi:hypothetical protein
MSSPMYCFRTRLRLGNHVKFDSEANEWTLATAAEHGEAVELRSPDLDLNIGEARDLVVKGTGYQSEQEAEAAAQRWRAFVQTAFARIGIGADFGDRAPRGGFTPAGLKWLEDQHGGRFLNNVHGTQVYECEPPPQFVHQEVAATVGKPEQRARDAIRAAHDLGIGMTDQEQLAYDLYSGSYFQPAADARFLMLTMALETLIDQEVLSDEVKAHVDQLIALTRGSSLRSKEIESMVGTLRWLYRESVSRAGRRLAEKLGDRLYMDGTEKPVTFFNRSYEMRSHLVHGYYPRPTRDEVDRRAANLETFVGNLLSLPLLEVIPD